MSGFFSANARLASQCPWARACPSKLAKMRPKPFHNMIEVVGWNQTAPSTDFDSRAATISAGCEFRIWKSFPDMPFALT